MLLLLSSVSLRGLNGPQQKLKTMLMQNFGWQTMLGISTNCHNSWTLFLYPFNLLMIDLHIFWPRWLYRHVDQSRFKMPCKYTRLVLVYLSNFNDWLEVKVRGEASLLSNPLLILLNNASTLGSQTNITLARNFTCEFKWQTHSFLSNKKLFGNIMSNVI